MFEQKIIIKIKIIIHIYKSKLVVSVCIIVKENITQWLKNT